MTKRFLNLSIICVVASFSAIVSLWAKEPNNAPKSSFSKVAGEPQSTLSNVNKISIWLKADGWSARNPITGRSGAVFPRGTTGVIFQDGILWGGLVNDGQEPRLRVGGSTYRSGTAEGAILGERTGITEDPTAADVRIWRIRKDWATADLSQDAAEFFDIDIFSVSDAQIADVRAQYGTDWDEWPAVKGAPFYDDNNDGVYDPALDRPGLADADHVVWFVANDLDSNAVNDFSGSSPFGLEHQVTIWAYVREGMFGNIIFRRNRLIYKGTDSTSVNATIDSMYITQWSDPDLGSFGDDFAGFDTLLNTGYVYNSSDTDKEFLEFGLPPPSIGYSLIQGPIVPSAGDEAIFDNSFRKNFKNLSLSSFVFQVAGSSLEPPSNTITEQWYNLMHGLQPSTGNDYVDPNTNIATVFTLSGDPIAGTGWIDGNPFGPGDRRILMSTGPFNMALGDTQEVIYALVAGMGGSRFESIVEMKKAARFAKSLNLNLFAKAPVADLKLAHPSASQTEVALTLNSQISVDEVIAEIYNYDHVWEATLVLLDDGNNGDGAANDNIWGNEWLTDQRAFGMYANVLIISGSDTTRWDHIIDNITTLGPVEWDELIIVSDNINEDGIINTGEKVVFSPVISNGSVLNIGPATIGTFLFDDYVVLQNTQKMTEVDSIPSGITNVGDTLSRYIVMADDTPDGHLLNLRYSIVDRQNNVWVSELQVLVRKLSFATNIKSLDHIEGTALGSVGYRIADPLALTEDIYEVTINEVESLFSFNLENLSTSTFLLTSEIIPDDKYSSTVPITEGFKVTFEDITFDSPRTYESAEFTFDSDPSDGDLELWGDGILLGKPTGFYRDFLENSPVPNSTKAQIDLQFRFTGVAPDNDSPVTSGGQQSTQWSQEAFGSSDLTGILNTQIRLPFELWDLEANAGAGRQIEVAVMTRNADGFSPWGSDVGTHWRITGGDFIIPIVTEYTDDADLERSPNDTNATWILFFTQNGSSVWSIGDEYTLKYVNPLQAGIDKYRFQASVAEEDENGLPGAFELSQNYPNPFNPETTIQYYLPVNSDVKLLIYNLLGQEVFRIEFANQKVGSHNVIWNGKNQRGNELSSGIYIYKFSAGDFVQTRKMVLLK